MATTPAAPWISLAMIIIGTGRVVVEPSKFKSLHEKCSHTFLPLTSSRFLIATAIGTIISGHDTVIYWSSLAFEKWVWIRRSSRTVRDQDINYQSAVSLIKDMNSKAGSSKYAFEMTGEGFFRRYREGIYMYTGYLHSLHSQRWTSIHPPAFLASKIKEWTSIELRHIIYPVRRIFSPNAANEHWNDKWPINSANNTHYYICGNICKLVNFVSHWSN